MKTRSCSFHSPFFSHLIVPVLLSLAWSVCAWAGTGNPTTSLLTTEGTGRVFLDSFETCAGGCDDADACTVDFCTTGGCIFDAEAANGRLCDDGDVCTVDETCSDGSCGAGLPLDCDDQNMCTIDSCDSVIGCINDALGANGMPCDDGDLCTVSETCSDGSCGAGLPLDCDDHDVCTIDSCDSVIGCISDTLGANGMPCDDGDLCTVSETCSDGSCGAGLPLDCDDQNMCTIDSCDSVIGCISDTLGANGMPCDDGDPETTGETCQAGVCSAP